MKQITISESYNKPDKYERGNHYVGISMWHFEWCTKYRYKMFGKFEYRNLVEACIRRMAFRHNIKIRELKVLPDHVHLTAGIPGTKSPSKALQLLKGGSAKLFFEKHPKARLRYPKGHLWSRGNFYASLGFIQVQMADRYVVEQEKHHKLASDENGNLRF